VSTVLDSREVAPFKPWPSLFRELRTSFAQGDHVTIIGPTGSGKTHIALEIAEIRAYVLVIACKAKDPLLAELRARGYYQTETMEIPYIDGTPVHKRVIYWPRVSEKMSKGDSALEMEIQSEKVRQALNYAKINGSWCLVIDEGVWVCRDLKLQRHVDALHFTGRTLGVSVILSAQRPSWVGQWAMSQADHLFIFQTAHREDGKSLGDIAGVDWQIVRDVVATLDADRHEFLYVSTRTREMYRSIAPPR
jgi:hypothetical protein